MNSTQGEPNGWLGDQRPRLSSTPAYVSSTGEEAVELAALAGLDLDPWQKWCLVNSLGERSDGKWSSFGVGVVVPRQNGKGRLLEARELAGLFILHERLIIHSAHQWDTSQEAFNRLIDHIDNTPELSKRLAKNGISRAHGSEGIKLKDGCRIRFRTRTSSGGRGFTCDCLILDEAMIIPDTFVSATLPTLSSRPNPQVWYTASAVDQFIHPNGRVLARVRERGLRGDESLFYAEWSADRQLNEVTDVDTTDPVLWAQANPALGIRIPTENIEHERREFDNNIRGFAVERLGIGDWPATDLIGERIIDQVLWEKCADEDEGVDSSVVFAYDVTPDRSMACIAVAAFGVDELPHIQVVDHRPGVRWLPDRIRELCKEHHLSEVVADGFGHSGSLAPEIESQQVSVKLLSTKDVTSACGRFRDAVVDDQRLRHSDQDELNAAVAGATTRQVGGGWAWDRKTSSVDISPLVACTLALWGLETTEHRGPEIFDLNEVAERLRKRQEGDGTS